MDIIRKLLSRKLSIVRIHSTRARVDHVSNDHCWLWYLLCVECWCVLSRYLSQYVEICCMINVCVLSRYLSQYVEICCLFNVCVCVVSLSQPSSRDLLYVKCLCVLSRFLSQYVEICSMFNICVCCLVISAQQ